MKKVRVIKEMPNCGTGNIFTVDSNDQIPISNYPVRMLIDEGWVEEIKKETLANKIEIYLVDPDPTYFKGEAIVKIIKKHFLETVNEKIIRFPSNNYNVAVEMLREIIKNA